MQVDDEQQFCDPAVAPSEEEMASSATTVPSARADDGNGDGSGRVLVAALIAAGVGGAIAAGVTVSRRRFMGLGAVAGAALLMPVGSGGGRGSDGTDGAGEADRPNIVWFRSEDNSADLIGAYGAADASTPNIDRLAAGGVLFRRFFTTSPVCAPTKLGWATGMYEAGMGPGHNMRASGRRPAVAVGFATWLAQAGYWCATSGNLDYNTDLGDDDGFHDRNGDWQSAARDGRPFVALLGSSTTHEFTIHGASPEITDPAAVEVPGYVPDDAVLRADRAAYIEKVSAVDAEVGALLDELEALGVAENTIVIYSSDHGGVTPRTKRFCYDSGLHAPLVAWFPERWRHLAPSGPGTVVESPVSSIDAAPTMLHLAGVDIPSHFQGTPFAGATCAPRTIAFSNRNRMDEAIDFVRTARDERYRYVRNYMPHLPWGQHVSFLWRQAGYRRWEQLHLEGDLDAVQDRFWGEKPAEELYDLETDPDEVHNLVDVPEHRDRLDALREALDEHMLAINDNGFIPEGSPVEGYDASREPGAYPLAKLMALGELAIARDGSNLDALLEALGDDNPVVRYWGALGCSMLGSDAEPASSRLVERMRDGGEDRWVRVQCADAVARAGGVEAAVDLLAEVAGHDGEPYPTRLQAVRSLALIGTGAVSATAALTAATADPNEYVSAAAQHALDVVGGTYAPVP